MHLSQSKLVVLWFSGLIVFHVVISLTLLSILPTFGDRVLVITVNGAPWSILEDVVFFFTGYSWLIFPELIGWSWCLLVWLGLYFFAAKVIVRLTLHSRGTR